MPPKTESGSTSDTPNTALHDQMLTLIRISTATAAKLDQLVNILLTKTQPPPPPPSPSPPPPPPPPQLPRPTKNFLPNFDGTNPLDWLFQATNYFEYSAIPPPQRLSLSVFYFTGEALSWYKHLANNQMLGTWPEFSCAFELRFGPSSYVNHQATLFKLKQTSTVSAYQTNFEKTSNCVVGLNPDALLNCFLSGLREDIQNEIALHKPTTLHQAYGLAKLLEDKLQSQLTPSDLSYKPPQTKLPLLPAPLPSPPTLPIKRLSPVEMQKRQAEGLCYNCPAKYQPGHQCNPPKFLLLQSENDPPWPYLTQNDSDLEDKTVFLRGSIDTST